MTQWGIAIPCAYDYCGWMMETLTMTNGGRYYNLSLIHISEPTRPY